MFVIFPELNEWKHSNIIEWKYLKMITYDTTYTYYYYLFEIYQLFQLIINYKCQYSPSNKSSKGRGHELLKCISDLVSNCEDLKRSLYLEDKAFF